MKKNTINWSAWSAEINKMRATQLDDIPEGWVTVEDFAAGYPNKITTSHARKLLSDLWRKGLADRKRFNTRVEGETGGIRPILHYRLKPLDKRNK